MNVVSSKTDDRGPISVLSWWGPSQSGCSSSSARGARRRFDDNREGTNRGATAAIATRNGDASGSPLIGRCGRAGQYAGVGVESRPGRLPLDLERHHAPTLSDCGLK